MTDKPLPDSSFEALLQFLKRTRGFDFTGYKRPSLERRFRRRMDLVGCKSYGDYLDHLEVDPDEYQLLFDTLLINVTEFFRDPATWEHLSAEAIPAMIERKPFDEPIRVWSAGCATGQEACTLAMILCEVLGDEAYQRRVKIYATDVDEAALDVARAATYTAQEVESVPPELRERYFERSDQRHTFRTDLRRTLIFGRNNLVDDAPISRLDLLVCRNTLMYMTAETQGHILRHFHFALRDTGVLVLGKSEMMISHRELFAAVDLKLRIFRKLVRGSSLQARVAGLVNGERMEYPVTDEDRQVREAALELSPLPQLVLTRTGVLSFANVAARALFGIGPELIGQPLAELPLAGSATGLRSSVDRAIADRQVVTVGQVEFHPAKGDARQLDVTVLPLLSASNETLGAALVFEDITRYGLLQVQLESNRRDLEAAYEELQSTIEELETTNEELQSSNEELQTTNEELQSTNEELETMNEELQSTNEELETINDELRERTGELNSVNDFLESILTSLGVAVAVIDRNQRVQIWNHGAEDLWGLRQDEAAEQHFLGLDIGLGPERLAPALRAVIGGSSDKETAQLKAVNRRGRAIVVETTVMPLVRRGADGIDVRGAIVLMEDNAADGHAADGHAADVHTADGHG
jgi:two-component system, chemotaxis family, CheB/CheR fusion protein